jgi:hypothetical protein
MFSPAEVARRGRHVLQLGLILAGVIGAVLWFWTPGMLRTMSGSPATSFLGTPNQARAVLLGLSLIMLTGVAFCLSGVRMIVGRSSRAATVAALGLFLCGCTVLGFVLVDAYGT